MKVVAFFLFALLQGLGDAAYSDGKKFVFSFSVDVIRGVGPTAQPAVIVIPLYNDTVCTFNYTRISDHKLVSFQKQVYYDKTNEFMLADDPKEIYVTGRYDGYGYGITKTNDFRIFAECGEVVKLIGRAADPRWGWGDLFIIPSIQNAAYTYTLSMPSAVQTEKGHLMILPVEKDQLVNLNIIGYSNGLVLSNQNVQYSSAVGENQRYISVYIYDSKNNHFNATVSIISNVPIMISMITSASTKTGNRNDGTCGDTCFYDYTAFMPISLGPIDCDSLEDKPDIRMITNDLTTRLYLSPANLRGNDCDDNSVITLYDDKTNINGNEEVVSNIGLTRIEMAAINQTGFRSESGQITNYRFGSFIDQDPSVGLFTHYVPSTEEWVSGKTHFYSLDKNCYLELYVNKDASDIAHIKLDGLSISKSNPKKTVLKMFSQEYTQFILPITGYGLHNLRITKGKYVLYVACKAVNSIHNGAGYLTGFEKRQ
uniref:IgGFc_binding domain-containing protein n=1 Tax=Rhabditophanes sp. KR3021 TaxID=114890 RepID=A0AC35UFE4_9BILA